MTWAASYEAYGKRTHEAGENKDRQRANTKDEETEFGILNEGFRYRDLDTGVWLSRDPAGFVDGPNLYAYVRQNPWTSWDPLGLWEESQKIKALREKWEATPVSLTRLGRGLQYAASALNPFDKDSNIRSACRELPQKIDEAANKLDNAPIPYPMKAMGKFSLGVGGAGASLNPIMAASSITETAQVVKEKGVSYVLREAVNSIKNDAINHPEMLIGNLMVGFATGNAVTKSGIKIPRITTDDGFLIKGFHVKAPFNIQVQRFGNLSLDRPDFWGPRIGSNPFINRAFAAIKTDWNPLTQLTTGVIPKGTPMKFGIVGPQGLKHPGGSLQFIVDSKKVADQAAQAVND